MQKNTHLVFKPSGGLHCWVMCLQKFCHADNYVSFDLKLLVNDYTHVVIPNESKSKLQKTVLIYVCREHKWMVPVEFIHSNVLIIQCQ